MHWSGRLSRLKWKRQRARAGDFGYYVVEFT